MAKQTLDKAVDALQKKAGKQFLRLKGGWGDIPTKDRSAAYDAYQAGIQKLQRDNPDAFSELQSRNTDAKLEMLNTLAFDMDEYGQEPISRKGLDNLETRLNVPFGTYDTGLGSRGIRQTLGATVPDTQGRGSNTVYVGGGMANKPEALKEVLRHEGQHTVPGMDSEKEARIFDNMYADVTGRERKGIPYGNGENTRDLVPTPADLTSYGYSAGMLLRNNDERQRGGSPDVGKLIGRETLTSEEVKALTSQERLSVLDNTRQWDGTGGWGLTRDLPNVGWFDESVDKVKTSLGF